MNATGTFDRVTGIYESFIQQHLVLLWTAAFADFGRSVPHGKKRGPYHEDPNVISAQNAFLLSRINEICNQWQFFEFLTLIRKVPRSAMPLLLTGTEHANHLESRSLQAIFQETVLFASNCALLYCPNDMRIQAVNERNHLNPSRQLMADATRAMILAAFHANNALYLNSVARRNLIEEHSFDDLLDIYNKRIRRAQGAALAEDDSPIMGLMPIDDLPEELRTLRVRWPGSPMDVRISWSNYFPAPTGSNALLKAYLYLDHPDFERLFGMPFQEFWRAWLTLNALVNATIPELDAGGVYIVDSHMKQARLERLFDICETGLGGGWRSEIKTNAYESVARNSPDIAPSHEAFVKCIDLATWSGEMLEGPGFVEQPYLFYPVGPDAAFWDYLRHGGFLKALSRRALRNSGKIGERKGELFEQQVLEEIRNIEGVTALRTNIVVGPAGMPWMEIDVAFVRESILYLLEVKSHFKSVRYYGADETAIQARAAKMAAFLEDRDQKLRQYMPALKTVFGNNISGGFNFLVTSEAELLPSFENTLWIEAPAFPRICLLEELKDCLKSVQPDVIKRHVAFVR